MRVLALGAFALVAAGSVFAEPRGFKVDDLVNLDRVADPRLSPDGRQVAFQLRETDYAANKGVQSLWLVPADGSVAPRRLTAKGATSVGPRWAQDSKSIYFLSPRSGSMQVWNLSLAGGETCQVSDYPLDVGTSELSPNGNKLAITFEARNDCDTN